MSTIPLSAGLAYQKFSVTSGDTRLRFYFRWLTRYKYYSVDISDSNGNPIALGRALHIGVNLLNGLNLDIGKIILEGEDPTINNLGINNKLIWTSD